MTATATATATATRIHTTAAMPSPMETCSARRPDEATAAPSAVAWQEHRGCPFPIGLWLRHPQPPKYLRYRPRQQPPTTPNSPITKCRPRETCLLACRRCRFFLPLKVSHSHPRHSHTNP